jgi:hypothetical protein
VTAHLAVELGETERAKEALGVVFRDNPRTGIELARTLRLEQHAWELIRGMKFDEESQGPCFAAAELASQILGPALGID